MDLGGVAEGLYTLRIDQLGADGKVASRVETPFQRDYPHAPPPRPGQPAAPAAGTVTVQPGNNLWTLARERYGSGVMYTQIFTANREQIRDPDLIYPGQIFSMPARTRSSSRRMAEPTSETSGASAWRTIRRVAPYLWPPGERDVKRRVVAGDGGAARRQARDRW